MPEQPSSLDETVRQHLQSFTPIDNIPRNQGEERRIINGAKASMLLYSQLASRQFSHLMNFEFEGSTIEVIFDELGNELGIDNPAQLFQACTRRMNNRQDALARVFSRLLPGDIPPVYGAKSLPTASGDVVPVAISEADCNEEIVAELDRVLFMEPWETDLRGVNNAITARLRTLLGFSAPNLNEIEVEERLATLFQDQHFPTDQSKSGFPGNKTQALGFPLFFGELFPFSAEGNEMVRKEGNEAKMPPARTEEFLKEREKVLTGTVLAPPDPSAWACEVKNNMCIQRFVRDGARRIPLSAALDDRGLRWQSLFRSKNTKEESLQVVLRFVDEETMRKVIVPCIFVLGRNQSQNTYHCCPLPGKQPLYNLPKLTEHPDHAVMLADSIEVAEANRNLHPHNEDGTSYPLTWTACLPDVEDWEHVDWSPLERRTVYYVITNHSRESLEDVCLKATKAKKQLDEHAEIGELRFAVVPVDYPNICYRDFRDYIDHCENEKYKPEVRSDDVRIYGTDELPDLIKKAEQRIELLQRHFHLREQAPGKSGQTHPPDGEDAKPRFQEWLLRPILYQGGLTILHAPEESGKSSFSLSMCGALLSDEPRDLVRGQWWLPPMDIRKTGSVLYFDFDSEGEQREVRDKVVDCLHPYLSEKKEKREESLQRFRVISVEEALDFSGSWFKDHDPSEHGESPAHKHIWYKIVLFRKSLEPEHPLRLVVIDNWFAMVGDPEPTNAWKYTKPLLKRITDSGAAVLLVHHSNRSGASAGLSNKRRQARMIVKMEIPQGEKTEDRDLSDSIHLKIDKKNRAIPTPDRKGCKIYIPKDGERWRVAQIAEKDIEDYALWRMGQTLEFIRNENDKSKRREEKPMRAPEIANVLGYGHERFNYYRMRYEGGTKEGKKIEGQKPTLVKKFGELKFDAETTDSE